ncbi:MAG TPA: transposase [Phycisphaerae bacterium]|nr:transposase [Phycisphaerae bacterium]HWB54510.1 transposase [Tepidisphaeraceae bacterium]
MEQQGAGVMAKELLSEGLWREVEPLLPAHPSHPLGGHPFVSDKDALRGLIFILRSGIPYQMLPQETFHASGSTCWRRMRDWAKAGVWPQAHQRLLAHLGRLKEVDLARAVADSASVRAVFGGRTPGPIQ